MVFGIAMSVMAGGIAQMYSRRGLRAPCFLWLATSGIWAFDAALNCAIGDWWL